MAIKSVFFSFYVRNINPGKIHPERITQNDKKFVNDLNYDKIGFPVQEKDFSKIETKSSICINVFCYEKKLVFPIYISDQKFENSMDLLFETDGDKSYYEYIKDFHRFMIYKTKNKSKKYFVKVVSSALVVKMCWQNIKMFVSSLMVHNL